jgi:hypothetical protein
LHRPILQTGGLRRDAQFHFTLVELQEELVEFALPYVGARIRSRRGCEVFGQDDLSTEGAALWMLKDHERVEVRLSGRG